MKTKFSAPVFEIKSLEETGLFSGYGAVFGNKDSYGDVIEPGAFSVSLTAHAARKSRPKMFWQHNMHEPIGSWSEMKEDNTGLWVAGKLNMDVQRGREAYSLLKAGDIDGLSIGYQTVKSEPDKKNGVLLLKQLELIEVSVVSVGANDRALIDAVKQIRGEALPTLPEFEGFLREAGFSKTEATAIAGNGLSYLLRSESDSEPTGEQFMASILEAMNANH